MIVPGLSGDVAFGSLYQLTEDKGAMPALAVAGSIVPFYGTLRGIQTDGLLLVTKSLNGSKNGPEVHLNVSWRHLSGGAPDDRENRYRAVFGISLPIGAETTGWRMSSGSRTAASVRTPTTWKWGSAGRPGRTWSFRPVSDSGSERIRSRPAS